MGLLSKLGIHTRNEKAHAMLMAGTEIGDKVDISTDYDGVILKITKNEEKLFEGTVNDAMFAYICLAHFLGKDITKNLDALKPESKWHNPESVE